MEKGGLKEGYDGERRDRGRETVWRKELEEKQSGALIAKSELKEQGRHAVIITDPI